MLCITGKKYTNIIIEKILAKVRNNDVFIYLFSINFSMLYQKENDIIEAIIISSIILERIVVKMLFSKVFYVVCIRHFHTGYQPALIQ